MSYAGIPVGGGSYITQSQADARYQMQSSSVNLTSGLIHAWLFAEAESGPASSFADSVGSLVMTADNPATLAENFGSSANGVSLSGCALSAAPILGTTAALSFWILIPEPNPSYSLAYAAGFAVVVNEGFITLAGDFLTVASENLTASASTWIHVVIQGIANPSADGYAELWVNNILIGSIDADVSTDLISGIQFGYDDSTGLYIAAPCIWNRLLSAAEISALFNQRNGLTYNPGSHVFG